MAFYQPLNPERKEIRVLVLAPGLFDDAVQVRLQVVSLSHGTVAVSNFQHDIDNIWDIASQMRQLLSDPDLEQQHRIDNLQQLYSRTRQLESQMNLDHHETEIDATYEAVSYCWGRQNLRAILQLYGQSFEAPASAVDVLRHLRLRHKVRRLWIDAICINQQDIQERELQVMMMGDIYRSAVRTVVWLGPMESWSQPALDLGSIILEQLPKDISAKCPADFRRALRDVILPQDTNVKVLEGIFLLEWFYRQWVLQEVATSKQHKCYIGDKTIDWLDIEVLTVWAYETKQWQHLRRIPELPCLTMSIRRGAPLHQSLSALALQSRKLLSMEPKDKIFALLSMTHWAERGEAIPITIRPNYRESQKLCMCRATKAMILEDESLSVLEEAETEPYTGPNGIYMKEEDLPWPSWCPPWHIPRSETKSVVHRLGGRWYAPPDRRADTKKWRGLKEDEDDCVLTLEGFTIETISQIASISSLGLAKIRSKFLVDDLFGPASNNDQDLPRSEPMWRLNTLVEITTAGKIMLPVDYGAEITEKSFDELKVEEKFFVQPASNSSKDWVEYNYAYPTISPIATPGRALFLTGSGRLGLGPRYMQLGDKLVVLYGSAWPFVLAVEPEHYRLVGPCYLQGARNDDLLATYEAEGRSLESFEIR